MAAKVLKFFSSLKLTVVCLGFALLLVFFGTLAQVDHGLWDTQARYFRSLFVYWPIGDSGMKIPVLPGGYLLGWVLLVNLLAAHYTRFKFRWNKTGIFMTHFGLIFLLLGQFLTEQFQVESQMRLEEGQSKNYSVADRHSELVVIDKSNPDHDQVVSIPAGMLAGGRTLSDPRLPVSIKVRDFFVNSDPSFRPPMMTNLPPAQGDQGIARQFSFTPAERQVRMDSRNIPTAIIELVEPGGKSLGTWAVSSWASDEGLVELLRNHWNQSFGGQMGDRLAGLIQAPQTFESGGRKFEVALRPTREYTPYSIGLIDFRHDVYVGTDTPRNYSSRVRLTNPSSGENREVLIKMNQPLRYAGTTYYQASFEKDQNTGKVRDDVTILQVVRNPAWLTPYISVLVIGAGLLVQFSIHLFKFAQRKAV
jgi:hypothetical protein